ncbi:GNAT family N-acetyltransferase [Roseomonas sp. CCTCC AB2023176]|uniref:GNAT family N-acetyltransferase n=1 Tax=Roseomonas sp. CCTCC AB2023176 TaxID=3342640 RepID=UPI0035D95C72
MPHTALRDSEFHDLSGGHLPSWCDAWLAREEDDLQASRGWYETTLSHAVPPGAKPVLLHLGAALLPMWRDSGRLRGMTTPYTLLWRPLPAHDADATALRDAGRRLARRGPPVVLDALDPHSPGLPDLLSGVRAGGTAVLAHDHFGNWHETLPHDATWESYLASRPSALRHTVARKMARALREARHVIAEAPGPALDQAIADYVTVRAASWKPEEPAPDFDPALALRLAPLGLLRLGVLRGADGLPLAAQIWVLDRGRRRATVLKLSHVEAARAASPGTVLTALMVRHLLKEDGVRELDFGRGDDAYKRMWVAHRRQRIGVTLAHPAHPAGVAAILRHLAGRGRRALRGIIAGREEAGT